MFTYRITIILVFGLFTVRGHDPRISERNYSQVFRDVPTLFQHIVDMLHEKPEILEKDDITTFLETAKDKLAELVPEENGRKVDKREADADYDCDKNTVDEAGQEYDWYLRKADDGIGRFHASMSPGASQLSPDEVAEMMIMVERKLEEYFNETK